LNLRIIVPEQVPDQDRQACRLSHATEIADMIFLRDNWGKIAPFWSFVPFGADAPCVAAVIWHGRQEATFTCPLAENWWNA